MELRASPRKLVLGALIVAGFVALGSALALGTFGDGPHYGRYAGMARPIGYLVTPYFTLLLALSLARLFKLKQPIITLSSQGLTDVNISGVPIPWPEITAIESFIVGSRHAGVLLRLRSDFLASFPLKVWPRLLGRLTRTVGPDFVVSDPAAVAIELPK